MNSRVLNSVIVGLSALALLACGMASDPPAWKQVFEQTTCEAMVPASCSGAYGFTVDSAGNYTAGPSPDGITRKGSLTSAESAALNTAASAYLDSVGESTPCQVQPSVPGVSDVVRIVNSRNTTIDVFEKGLQTIGNCVTADTSKAAALTAQVQQLRQKYYPVPFPTS